jgi:phage baseplate assembly protein V
MRDYIEKMEAHIAALYDECAKANMRSADLARRLDNMFRPGKVTDVDTKKQLYRQEIAEQDGTPVKSAWIPYGQIAGDYKSHTPPTKGQQMWMLSPNGDARQAVGVPMTWSDDQKSPSEKEDEHVHTYGDKYRLKEKKDERTFTLDKAQQSFKDNKITSSVNGGNTPKDSNGAKADDGNGQNDQAASGSSITQEEKTITHKTPSTTIVHGEKEYSITASDKITFTVGGSEFELTPQGFTIVAAQDGVVAVGGFFYSGMAGKDDKSGALVKTDAGSALKHKSKA